MKLLNLFKSIKDFIKIKNNDLSFLSVGDIIWAKRYENEEEKNKIPIGHREGPYVIIKQTKNKTYGLQCTSNPHQNVKWKHVFYAIGRLSYEFNKNSYICTGKLYELNDSKYIKVMNHLSDKDLNNLYKSLYIVLHSAHKYKSNLKDSDIKFNFDIGDIIKYENMRYLIYDLNNKNYYCYGICNKNKEKNKILINNTYYTFSFMNTVTIPKKAKIELLDWLNTGELELVYKKKEDILNKVNREIKIGTIIKVESEFYYIVDVLEDKYKVYRIIGSSLGKYNSVLIAEKGYYYTDLKLCYIDKNCKAKIRKQASDEEIKHNASLQYMSKQDRIKDKCEILKSPYLKKETILSKNLIPKTIVINTNTNKYYLILSKKDNILEIVNINEMKDYCYFEVTDDNNPFEIYRVVDDLEFDRYRKKIDEFMNLVSTFKR